MSEKERADEDIRVYKAKFTRETIRSVVFWSLVMGVTYWAIKPYEAWVEYKDATRKLQIELSNNIKAKLFDHRMKVLEDFISKSDEYTKHVANTYDEVDLELYRAYEEEVINSYNLQLARMKTIFRTDLDSSIDAAIKQRKALHAIMRNMKVFESDEDKEKNIYNKISGLSETNKNKARVARRELVEKNIAITKEATSILFAELIEKDSN